MCRVIWITLPDSKVHGANMGPIWDRQDPGGPNVGTMNFAICASIWKERAILFLLYKSGFPDKTNTKQMDWSDISFI